MKWNSLNSISVRAALGSPNSSFLFLLILTLYSHLFVHVCLCCLRVSLSSIFSFHLVSVFFVCVLSRCSTCTPKRTATTSSSSSSLSPSSSSNSYYLYFSEYCYLALEPNDPGGRMCNVYDLQVGLGDIYVHVPY